MTKCVLCGKEFNISRPVDRFDRLFCPDCQTTIFQDTNYELASVNTKMKELGYDVISTHFTTSKDGKEITLTVKYRLNEDTATTEFAIDGIPEKNIKFKTPIVVSVRRVRDEQFLFWEAKNDTYWINVVASTMEEAVNDAKEQVLINWEDLVETNTFSGEAANAVRKAYLALVETEKEEEEYTMITAKKEDSRFKSIRIGDRIVMFIPLGKLSETGLDYHLFVLNWSVMKPVLMELKKKGWSYKFIGVDYEDLDEIEEYFKRKYSWPDQIPDAIMHTKLELIPPTGRPFFLYYGERIKMGKNSEENIKELFNLIFSYRR